MGMIYETLTDTDPERQGLRLAKAGAATGFIMGSALAFRFARQAAGHVTERVFKAGPSESLARTIVAAGLLTATAAVIEVCVPEVTTSVPAPRPASPVDQP